MLIVKIPRLPLFAALTVASLLAGSAIASAHPAAQAPTTAQITARLRHTIEIGTKGEYFRALGHPIKTIKDGRGTGTLTAVVGNRWPTADAKGQVVFFWHNQTFIGQSASYETTAVGKITSPALGTFIIPYARYKPTDPVCCPTLKPLKVTYSWSGHTLISNGVPPRMGPRAVRVKYQP
jgi:hypothetical protein